MSHSSNPRTLRVYDAILLAPAMIGVDHALVPIAVLFGSELDWCRDAPRRAEEDRFEAIG